MSNKRRRGNAALLKCIVNESGGEKVQEAVESLREKIYAESTKKSNCSRVRKYEEVMAGDGVNKQAFPIDREKLECFAAVLCASGYKSVNQYLDAVVAENEARGYELTNADKSMVRKWKRACTRGQGQPEGRDPLTIDLLLELHRSAIGTNARSRAALYTIGCWFLLRGEEAVELEMRDIQSLDAESGLGQVEKTAAEVVKVTVRESKTDQRGEGAIRVHGCICANGEVGRTLCPVHLLKNVVTLRKREGVVGTDKLFRDEDGVAWYTDRLRYRLLKDLRRAGVTQVDKFGLHSMRVGGTQWMLRAGVERHRVQRFGRWSSEAISLYARDVCDRIIQDSQEYSGRMQQYGHGPLAIGQTVQGTLSEGNSVKDMTESGTRKEKAVDHYWLIRPEDADPQGWFIDPEVTQGYITLVVFPQRAITMGSLLNSSLLTSDQRPLVADQTQVIFTQHEEGLPSDGGVLVSSVIRSVDTGHAGLIWRWPIAEEVTDKPCLTMERSNVVTTLVWSPVLPSPEGGNAK
ncbi:hypothetical protein FOL47_000456 [Perkinsus chesapeaki]|uniref:Tyr recombinase domain-containing protein n=1 Tax=Perkinsus chesapeaki TaxID=330153 RepID=A0A7J6KVV9_PERCH|nr:hypothetical protein FOL47_000456 [Perkinsus chesapeaki]